VDALEDFPELLPCLLPIHHRDWLEQNAFLNRLGFEVVAFFEVELPLGV